ncbi:MAG: exopolyphosphatase [Actinomycetales bacterium]
MKRVAAFDCGTNSLRLLIADVDAVSGSLVDVDRQMEVVRLGEGVDATGMLSNEAMRRAFEVTRRYAIRCADAGVEAIRFVATSASRDAVNAGEFTTGIQAILGVRPEVISGVEEARLSFEGATSGLADRLNAGPVCVVDLGGGSTEIVVASPADLAGTLAAHSMNVGCVRMTERHLHSDPPTPDQVAAASIDIDRALNEVEKEVPIRIATSLVGVAGTVTTVTAHALGLRHYQPELIHGTALSVPQTQRVCQDLLWMPREARAALGFMHPGRVDVIGSGALVWSRVVRRMSCTAGISEVITSEHDILDGIALALGRGD